MTDILSVASQHYKLNLKQYPKNPHALYLYEKRGFTEETINTFGMGFSKDKTSLPSFLQSQGYTADLMREFGLVADKEGSIVDFLSNRVTLEIKDVYGSIIGIAGRVITSRKEYKYLNPKTTPVFSKCKTLFNLDKAKDYLDYLNDPYLIVTEGYFDVISLWQYGIRNVVCLMGTACSEFQANLLKMFCRKVIVCLDGDKAGQLATKKTTDILSDYGIETHTLVLPNNLDPDEILHCQNGKKIFLDLLTKSLKNT